MSPTGHRSAELGVAQHIAHPSISGAWFSTADACWLGEHGRPPVAGLRVVVAARGPLAETIRADVLALGGVLVDPDRADDDADGSIAGPDARTAGGGRSDAADADLVVGTLAELTPPAGGDRAGGDRAAGDLAGGDRAGGDRAAGDLAPVDGPAMPGPEGFLVWSQGSTRVIAGADARGMLYGFLALARLEQAGAGHVAPYAETPATGLRMVDQWDNMTAHPVMGEVERGYAGRSLLYRDGQLAPDRERIRDYARLLASVGINAICVNNPNVHAAETDLITTRLDVLAELAAAFGAYGLTCYVAVNFAAPLTATPPDAVTATAPDAVTATAPDAVTATPPDAVTGRGSDVAPCTTADPMNPRVGAWWTAVATRIYARIPGFGGFLVKADSEGEPGPFAYGRTHAEGANVLARALAPHGGKVLWRCFVYNHRQDWRDRRTDRARAAYDHFVPLDGQFDDNVVLQVKFGPMDFQVREPVSPLIGALRATNVAVEWQITQEYTGQQRHVYYLATQWREILDTLVRDDGATVADVVTGRASTSPATPTAGHPAASPAGHPAAATADHPHPTFGLVAVSNVGDSEFWTGHPLAQANLYAYGRLAWDPGADPRGLAEEWSRATYGPFPGRSWLVDMLVDSRSVYEGYTAPLGVGFMVTPGTHGGPSVDGYEYSPWGTYHFADRDGIGVDRTVATGSGFTGQYPPRIAARYEDVATCPDEDLLFFHHVRYDHRLSSGKTVAQHVYDTHFDAVAAVERWRAEWPERSAGLPEAVRAEVGARLGEQERSAREWRDQICTYFLRHSGLGDGEGRQIYP